MATLIAELDTRPVVVTGAKATDLMKSGPTLYVNFGRPLTTLADVREALQLAIELEHATLPPYLTALYSLDEAKNPEIAAIMTGIAMQEMEHFCRAGNILVAIGGKPAMANEEFIPSYPGGLPKHIGSSPSDPDFIVHLRKFSMDQVKNCFMKIEEPEYPIDIQSERMLATADTTIKPAYRTIGEFYEDIKATLTELGDGIFNHTSEGQVFGLLGLAPVMGLEDAKAQIDTIIIEGEGSRTSPTEGPFGQMAHYYSYYEIYKGRKTAKEGDEWYFTDEVIPFDPTGVQDLIDDPHQDSYPAGSTAAYECATFNTYYSNLLIALDQSFNGQPDRIGNAIGLMFDIKLQAKKLMSIPMPGQPGKFASPSWQFTR
jgi:hypothetical protein